MLLLSYHTHKLVSSRSFHSSSYLTQKDDSLDFNLLSSDSNNIPSKNFKLFLDPNKLNYSYFKNELDKINCQGELITWSKLKYDDDKFCMIGNQKTLNFNLNLDPEYRTKITKELITLIDISSNDFEFHKLFTNPENIETEIHTLSDKDLIYIYFFGFLTKNITSVYYEYGMLIKNHIQINFTPKIHSLPKLPKIRSNFSLNKEITSVTETRRAFKSSILPLTLDDRYYGKKSYSTFPYSDVQTFINKDSHPPKKTIVSKINDKTSKKQVFHLKTDVLLAEVVDTDLGDNCFTRQNKNVTLLIKNNVPIQQTTSIKLPKISKKKDKHTITTHNDNIGTFDLETFKDDNTTKVYALGFTVKGEKNSHLFYLNDDAFNSDDLVLCCINRMLVPAYNNFIFYTHNLGGYDSIFILKTLLEVNKKIDNFYKISCVFKDSQILRLTIQCKDKNSPVKIHFVDSLKLLPSSLASLCKSFGTEITKGVFPYEFVKSSTLNYIGVTPPQKYFKENRKIISNELYKQIFKHDWNLKEETLYYLERDLLSLLEVIDEFNRTIFIKYNLQLTECLTISTLAFKIFTQNYMNTKIPTINTKSIYTDIKKAYFGGMTEVYKPYGENLYYYDVNSLYPYVALQPMIGCNCEFIESFDSNLDLDKLFGFFYCRIETPSDDYLGLLPVKQNNVILPLGVWEGWYFSELLKFAANNGYKIKVIKGYNFDKVNNVFNNYVNDLYTLKSNSSGAQRSIAKYLLNSLLGRYGLDILKTVTKIVDKQEFNNILCSHIIKSEKHITENDIIVNFQESISQKLCEENNVDYFALLNKLNKETETTYKYSNVSVGISAAVTAYANIFMSQIKLDLLKKNINIFYMDTDSIVCDKPLDNSLIGSNLGQFKLEYKIKKAFFISAKTYCLVTDDDKIIIKAKGVYDDSLSLKDFESLYHQKNVKAIKGDTKKNWEGGFVDIGTKQIELSSDSYTKRTKIFKDNIWVDTKPLILWEKKILKEIPHSSIIYGEFYNSLTQFILYFNNSLDIKIIDKKLDFIRNNILVLEYNIKNKVLSLSYTIKFYIIKFNDNSINKHNITYKSKPIITNTSKVMSVNLAKSNIFNFECQPYHFKYRLFSLCGFIYSWMVIIFFLNLSLEKPNKSRDFIYIKALKEPNLTNDIFNNEILNNDIIKKEITNNLSTYHTIIISSTFLFIIFIILLYSINRNRLSTEALDDLLDKLKQNKIIDDLENKNKILENKLELYEIFDRNKDHLINIKNKTIERIQADNTILRDDLDLLKTNVENLQTTIEILSKLSE